MPSKADTGAIFNGFGMSNPRSHAPEANALTITLSELVNMGNGRLNISVTTTRPPSFLEDFSVNAAGKRDNACHNETPV